MLANVGGTVRRPLRAHVQRPQCPGPPRASAWKPRGVKLRTAPPFAVSAPPSLERGGRSPPLAFGLPVTTFSRLEPGPAELRARSVRGVASTCCPGAAPVHSAQKPPLVRRRRPRGGAETSPHQPSLQAGECGAPTPPEPGQKRKAHPSERQNHEQTSGCRLGPWTWGWPVSEQLTGSRGRPPARVLARGVSTPTDPRAGRGFLSPTANTRLPGPGRITFNSSYF